MKPRGRSALRSKVGGGQGLFYLKSQTLFEKNIYCGLFEPLVIAQYSAASTNARNYNFRTKKNRTTMVEAMRSTL